MSITTYVISLKNEIVRRDRIKESLLENNVDFKFIDAVDLRGGGGINYNKSKKNNTAISRLMTIGEVGCALSHVHCYEKIIESNDEWTLILEDDAIVSNLNDDAITSISSEIKKFDIDVVILGYSKLKPEDERIYKLMEPVKVKANCNGFSLGTPWKNWTCGTVAYLINQRGAKKLLSYYQDNGICTVADDWGYFEKEVGLKIFHIRPLLVFEDFLNLPSSIENERAILARRQYKFFDFIRVLRGLFRRGVMIFK